MNKQEFVAIRGKNIAIRPTDNESFEDIFKLAQSLLLDLTIVDDVIRWFAWSPKLCFSISTNNELRVGDFGWYTDNDYRIVDYSKEKFNGNNSKFIFKTP